MIAVKTSTPHAAVLLAELLGQIRTVFALGEWNGLRTSHFRVLSAIDRDGSTITGLADGLGMTKQGAGQFVTALTDRGLLVVDSDPGDRRVRVVRRTGDGDAVVVDVERQIAAIEEAWAAEVGTRRYAAFRAVLTELAALDGVDLLAEDVS